MARKRPPLSTKRAEYVEARKRGLLVGKPLHYPAGVADRYKSSLNKLSRDMKREYQDEIEALWKEFQPATMDASLASQARIALNKLSKLFDKKFRDRASSIVKDMLGGIDKASSSSLKQSLKELSGGLTLKTSIMTQAMKESMTAAAAENVGLIKSIATQYHERVEGAVMRSIQKGGEGRKTIMEELERIGGMTDRRINIIAEDQTRKATTSINAMRNKELGIKKFRWVHSGGGVDKRESHVKADGKIFSYDDPPKIGDKGEAVLPGYAISCRCVAVPVLDWGQDE